MDMDDDAADSYRPLETPYGIPQGRDAFYLAEIEEKMYPRELILRGQIEGLIEAAAVPFTLRFRGLLELHAIELDFSDFHGRPAFVEVLDCRRIAELRRRDHSAKVGDPHHYIIRTYDEVFDVICADYQLTLGEPAPHRYATDDELDDEDEMLP